MSTNTTTQNERTIYFGGKRVINSTLRIYFGSVSKSGNLISYCETENRPFIERSLPLIQRRQNIVGLNAVQTNLKLNEIWEIKPVEYRQREVDYLLKINLPSLQGLLETVKSANEKNHITQIVTSVVRINQRNSALVRSEANKKLISLMSESEKQALKAEKEAKRVARESLKLGLEKRQALELEYKEKQRLLAAAKDEKREAYNEALKASREAAKKAKETAESVVERVIKGQI